MLHAFGASVQDADANVVLRSPATVEAVKVAATLYRTSMTEEVLSWDAASDNRFLVSGRGSLIFNPVSGLRAFEEQDAAQAGQVGLAPPRAGPAGRLGTHSFLGVSVIWRFAEHPELARQFLLDRTRASRDAFVESAFYNLPAFPGSVPELPDLVAHDSKAQPAGKYALLAEAADRSTNIGHPGYANAAMDEVFNLYLVPKMFARAARGEATPEDTVAAAAAEIGPIFDRWREQGKI